MEYTEGRFPGSPSIVMLEQLIEERIRLFTVSAAVQFAHQTWSCTGISQTQQHPIAGSRPKPFDFSVIAKLIDPGITQSSDQTANCLAGDDA